MRPLAIALVTAALAAPGAAHGAARIVLDNVDAPDEGFNDPTPAPPVGGNAGTTVGEQRRIAFARAAAIWGAALDSSVEIRVRASFDPLPCDATTTWLGFGGTSDVFSDFPNAPEAGVLYPGALADKLAGEDLAPGDPDASIQLNSALNGDAGCLNGSTWYYGLDHQEAETQVELLPVLLHELGHGLGFQTFVDRQTGALFQGLPDHYSLHVLDTSLDRRWPAMSDAERAQSATNYRNVVWAGEATRAAVPGRLTPGTPSLLGLAPEELVDRYVIGTALFGPPLSATAVEGVLRYAADSAGDFDGCEPYAAEALTGKVALIDRGACDFVLKVKHAQDAGAIAAIVADNVVDTVPVTMSGEDPTILIPSVFVLKTAGDRFKAALGGPAPATARLLEDPAVYRGADPAHRMMLYAPNPPVPSSSISHFDRSAAPDELMEPSLSRALTDDLGLAAPLLRDLGWYPDADGDLVRDEEDGCVHVPDPDQEDLDGDEVGDACDEDDDGDGVADDQDLCPRVPDPLQKDRDRDERGDLCDPDRDGDGEDNAADNCPDLANPNQHDRNSDGAGDVCDDEDGDGKVDAGDNCRDLPNPDQRDQDRDGRGDACDDSPLPRVIDEDGGCNAAGGSASPFWLLMCLLIGVGARGRRRAARSR
jgi:PA domain/Thrombospondin type 3 repeat